VISLRPYFRNGLSNAVSDTVGLVVGWQAGPRSRVWIRSLILLQLSESVVPLFSTIQLFGAVGLIELRTFMP
jgi:hypothetical protein